MIGQGAVLGGLAVLLVTLASVFAATSLLLRDQPRSGALAVLAHATVATALLLAVHVIPGVLGILDRWTVVGAALLCLAVAAAIRGRRGAPFRSVPAPTVGAPAGGPPRSAAEARAGRLLVAAAGLAGGYAAVYLLRSLGTPPTGIDALTFHLPGVASWIHSGTLWQIDQFAPQLAHGNYPNNGDVLFLAVVLPLRSALLVRGVMAPYLALMVVGIYAVARQIGATRSASLSFAALLAAVPAIVGPAIVDTETDTLMLFGLAAGAAFLLSYRSGGRRADLLLAGIALGVSFGTKWYAVPCVLAIVVLWAAARLLSGCRPRATLRELGWLLGLIALFGGVWLVRNLVESGDPVFPLRVAPLGLTLFDAPPDVVAQKGGFTIGDYLLAPHVLGTYVLPAIRYELAPLGVLLVAGGLVGGAVAGAERRHGRRSAAPAAWLAVAALALAVIYVVTPDSALGPLNHPTGTVSNVRYLMPALLAAAPVAAWLCGRLGRFGLAIEAAALALSWPALTRSYGFASGAALTFAVLVGLAGLVWPRLVGRSVRFRPRLRARVLYPALLAAVLAAGLAGRSRSGYSTYARADATIGWLIDHAPAGHRVGLAGVWSIGLPPVFPAYGPRLGNRVRYVGPWVRHLLEQYSDPVRFTAALRRGGIDLLEIGLGFPEPRPSVPEESWAHAAGFHQVARSPRFALLARQGRPGPVR